MFSSLEINRFTPKNKGMWKGHVQAAGFEVRDRLKKKNKKDPGITGKSAQKALSCALTRRRLQKWEIRHIFWFDSSRKIRLLCCL